MAAELQNYLIKLAQNVNKSEIFNPLDTKGFGATSDTKGGGGGGGVGYQGGEIFVRYRFILESLIKGKVDQISFAL